MLISTFDQHPARPGSIDDREPRCEIREPCLPSVLRRATARPQSSVSESPLTRKREGTIEAGVTRVCGQARSRCDR